MISSLWIVHKLCVFGLSIIDCTIRRLSCFRCWGWGQNLFIPINGIKNWQSEDPQKLNYQHWDYLNNGKLITDQHNSIVKLSCPLNVALLLALATYCEPQHDRIKRNRTKRSKIQKKSWEKWTMLHTNIQTLPGCPLCRVKSRTARQDYPGGSCWSSWSTCQSPKLENTCWTLNQVSKPHTMVPFLFDR